MHSLDDERDEALQALTTVLHALFRPLEGGFDWKLTAPMLAAQKAAASGDSIRLTGDDRTVVLSPGGFARWLSDYFPNIPLSLAGDTPSDADRKLGIGWVLRVGPPGREPASAQELNLSPELSRVIAAEYARAKNEDA